jgi:hypothetical protein
MDTSLPKERALTENAISCGKRVATEHEWKPGDPALAISKQDAVSCQARVIYCKPLEKGRFAIGLKLFTRVERSAKPP